MCEKNNIDDLLSFCNSTQAICLSALSQEMKKIEFRSPSLLIFGCLSQVRLAKASAFVSGKFVPWCENVENMKISVQPFKKSENGTIHSFSPQGSHGATNAYSDALPVR